MADKTNSGYIEFLEFHRPDLQSGLYHLTITQTVNAPETKDGNEIDNATFSKEAQFFVAGDRVTIPPQKIHSVFPPAGSLGDHSTVLPHIIFNTSTLPWQRRYNKTLAADFESQVEALKAKLAAPEKAQLSTDEIELLRKLSIPWMALLLFHEEEIQDQSVRGPKVAQRKDLATGNDFFWNPLDPEPGEKPEDKITVIDVKTTLLKQLLPAEEDLEFLSHVRLLKNPVTPAAVSTKPTADSAAPSTSANPTELELAVIVGNRLPKPMGSSTVHLVSLEQQFDANGQFIYPKTGKNESLYVRLISLKSWSFSCIDPDQGFEGLLKNINRPASESGANPENNTLRISSNSINKLVKNYFDIGSVALPHTFRDGSKSISWYRGPFISGPSPIKENTFPLPILDSDQLLLYRQSLGMFDVSYAAAWELGRLLALQSKDFSYSLYNWKRQQCQKTNIAAQSLQYSHLAQAGEKPAFTIPTHITSWLNNLNLLKGLPFNYLVPDERMLPLESIRFFQVDPSWVECLLDGAFSIGRVNDAERTRDSSHLKNPATNQYPQMSGFLMRSDVVSGWPALQVNGSSTTNNPKADVELLRMERLSKNTLLCLFKTQIKAVGFHVKPEALHYGFEPNGDAVSSPSVDDGSVSNENKLKIIPRGADGKPIDAAAFSIQVSPQSVVNISNIVSHLPLNTNYPTQGFSSPITSAQFALSLSDVGDEVWFKMESA